MSKKFYILVLGAVLSTSTPVWSGQRVFRGASEEIAQYGIHIAARILPVRGRFFSSTPHTKDHTSCVRRFLTREYSA